MIGNGYIDFSGLGRSAANGLYRLIDGTNGPFGQTTIQGDASDILDVQDAGGTSIFTLDTSGDTALVNADLTVIQQGGFLTDSGLIVTDSLTDSTDKNGKLLVKHYDTDEEDITVWSSTSTSGSQSIYWGGGPFALNSMTSHRFYAGATNTTLGGSVVFSMNVTNNASEVPLYVDVANARAFEVRTSSLNVLASFDTSTFDIDLNGTVDQDVTSIDAVADFYGATFQVSTANTADNGRQHIGLSGRALHNDAFDLTESGVAGILGCDFASASAGSGTVTNAYGVGGYVGQFGSGTITNAVLFNGALQQTSGTITNGYFMYPENNIGTVGTNYLIKLPASSDWLSNSRAFPVDDNGTTRYIMMSNADTGLTLDSQDVTIGTTTSGDVILNPVGVIDMQSGVKHNTTRVTSGPYTVLAADHEIFVDTDSAPITVNLPAGSDGTNYRIINTGSSGNNVTVAPNGAELLLGVNSNLLLADGNVVILTYETTEGWW